MTEAVIIWTDNGLRHERVNKWSSLTYSTSARHERHGYNTSNTSAILATRVRHECNTSETRVTATAQKCSLRRGYTVKYFFQNISWNAYFTLVSLCKLPRNVYDFFLKPFMKYKNFENRFSEFSLLWKTFLLNLFSCLIKFFIINDVCKNLKENVNVKVKSKDRVVSRTLY